MPDAQFWPPQRGDIWISDLEETVPKAWPCHDTGWLHGGISESPAEKIAESQGPLRLIWRDARPVVHDQDDETEAIHTFFGLSYCSYLVLPRVLLQSMPDEWQARFVAVMREYDDAVHGIEQAEIYDVIPGRAAEAGCLNEAERRATGVTVVEPDEDEDGEYLDPEAETKYYDKDGNEIENYTRIVIPIADPLPPYNRGRTIIPEVRAQYNARGHAEEN